LSGSFQGEDISRPSFCITNLIHQHR